MNVTSVRATIAPTHACTAASLAAANGMSEARFTQLNQEFTDENFTWFGRGQPWGTGTWPNPVGPPDEWGNYPQRVTFLVDFPVDPDPFLTPVGSFTQTITLNLWRNYGLTLARVAAAFGTTPAAIRARNPAVASYADDQLLPHTYRAEAPGLADRPPLDPPEHASYRIVLDVQTANPDRSAGETLTHFKFAGGATGAPAISFTDLSSPYRFAGLNFANTAPGHNGFFVRNPWMAFFLLFSLDGGPGVIDNGMDKLPAEFTACVPAAPVAPDTVPPALRLAQRNDGFGANPAPRLRAGTGASTSVQTSVAPRVGSKNRYL